VLNPRQNEYNQPEGKPGSNQKFSAHRYTTCALRSCCKTA
jgi:hypothetical protein